MASYGKKPPKQDVSTFLQTAENLQESKKAPLSNLSSTVAQGVTGATQKASQQATQETGKIAAATGKDALGKPFTVNQSAYTAPSAATYAPAPVSTTTAPTTTQQLATNLSSATYDPSQALADVSNQAQQARSAVEATRSESRKEAEGRFDPLSQYLTEAEKGKRVTYDAAGNIVGSERGTVGQVGALGTNEAAAQQLQENLAAQDRRSNVDALSALLGWGYDPDTAALDSQVYQGDVAKLRGQATEDTLQGKFAEKSRTASVEDYLKSLTEGKKSVGEAKTGRLEEIDETAKKANKEIEAALEDATKTIKDKTTKAKIKNIDENLTGVLDELDRQSTRHDVRIEDFDDMKKAVDANLELDATVKEALKAKIDAFRDRANLRMAGRLETERANQAMRDFEGMQKATAAAKAAAPAPVVQPLPAQDTSGLRTGAPVPQGLQYGTPIETLFNKEYKKPY